MQARVGCSSLKVLCHLCCYCQLLTSALSAHVHRFMLTCNISINASSVVAFRFAQSLHAGQEGPAEFNVSNPYSIQQTSWSCYPLTHAVSACRKRGSHRSQCQQLAQHATERLGEAVALIDSRCLCMQEEGPTEADVSSLRSIEQRNWENLQQENAYWQQMLESSYMSRSYQVVRPYQLDLK